MGDGLRKEQVRNSFPFCLCRWELVQRLSLAQPSQDTSVSCQNHTSTSDHPENFSPCEQHPHLSKLRHQSRATERAARQRAMPQCKREQSHKKLECWNKELQNEDTNVSTQQLCVLSPAFPHPSAVALSCTAASHNFFIF